jgi:RNA polymerase sigma-70 factor (ECF subfamily)
MMMDSDQFVAASGPVDARYLAFLETVSTLRPSLHRYCARMTGSVMDGEDVVQEALIEAYRKLDQFDESRPLKPWLFRIAHNRSIDFLRRKGVRDEAEAAAAVPEAVSPAEPAVLGLGTAVERLVITLPPKERASVLLKDVFDYSLKEIADLIDTTVGGVKAALNRGRTKLASSPAASQPAHSSNPELTRIMQLYVDHFNRRDWDGVRELISADARLTVADRFAGKFGARLESDRPLGGLGLKRHVALRIPFFIPAVLAIATDLVLTVPRTLAKMTKRITSLRTIEPPRELKPFPCRAGIPAEATRGCARHGRVVKIA